MRVTGTALRRPLASALAAPAGVLLAAVGLTLGAAPTTVAGQTPDAAVAVPPLTTAGGEWPSYGGDAANTRYSPLDQIDASNFDQLEIAWRFRTDNLGPAPEFKLEGTPVMAGGVVYATAGTRRAVVALDAATGELLWLHREDEGARAAASPRRLSGRGLAYWTDGDEARILYVTIGFRLVALDARTGARVAGFGGGGVVDLKAAAVVGDGRPIDFVTGPIGTNAAPTVARDVVLVGGTFADGAAPATHNNVKGLVQAFDVRSGERLWTFRTVPRPGEFGADTWLANSWGSNGNNGVWTQISADPELGIAYLPVETPTGDYYGGHRPGDNLFAESLVAVDLATGERDGRRGFLPISANFLMENWVPTHWANYVQGCEEAERTPDRADWRVARSVFVNDDHRTALDYGRANGRSPYRFYYRQLFTKLRKLGRHAAFKPTADFPDEELTLDFIVDRLVLAGDPESVTDQLLAFREVTGDFGTLLYAGKDWEDKALGRRSMELMAEKVMPAVNAAIGGA